MKPFFLLFIVWPSVLCAQLNETFSDGEIFNNPQWFGQVDSFIVNSDYQLQLNATAAGSSFLFTSSDVIEQANWSFKVKYEFSPSGSNYARVFLAMDNSDPSNITNAIFCDIGKNSDRLELGVITNGEERIIIQGEDGILSPSSNELIIRVTREGNTWTLEYDSGLGFMKVGEMDRIIEMQSSWFGILCNYTVTRAQKFFFDDINVDGEPYTDVHPPKVIDYEVVNGGLIRIVFNEDLNINSFNAGSFYLTKLERSASVLLYNEASKMVELYFNPGLEDVEDDILVLSHLEDLAGNVMATELIVSYHRVRINDVQLLTTDLMQFEFSKAINADSWIQANLLLDNQKLEDFEVSVSVEGVIHQLKLVAALEEGRKYQLKLNGLKDITGDTLKSFQQDIWYYHPARFDIVINEVMVDPSPTVALPENEYIELYNRSEFDLSLKDWKVMVNDKSFDLPDSLIKAGTYVLLVPSGSLDFWQGSLVGVDKWQTLNNSGFDLVVKNEQSEVIDAFKYNPTQIYGEGFKEEGGWSVERLDVNNMSGKPDNWKWSVDYTGGTPLNENSVMVDNPDFEPPWFVYSEFFNDSTLRIHFSEVMNLLNNEWSFEIFPVLEDFNSSIDSVFLSYVDITINPQLEINKVYSIGFNKTNDWAGNDFSIEFPIRFAKPDSLVSGDIIINEVLFNPSPDGVDFIELVNRSNKVINLNDVYLGDWDEDKTINKLYPITDRNRMIFPDDYLLLSQDSLIVLNLYRSENHSTFLNTKLPSLPDDEGVVIICNQSGNIIDYLEYKDDMHFDLIRDPEGVSLERLAIDQPTNDHQNWHSAASDVLATPGYSNSQTIKMHFDDKSIYLDYDVFTPNNDGRNDQLIIRYNNTETDVTINIRIFDSTGREVRYLANNVLLHAKGYFLWDGLDDANECLKPGIYIVYCQCLYPNGMVKNDKLVCVIGVESSN
ncbi:lamin tail domain-containing protein [Carboxylicivirga caseinilyticus]|uniref:lamin tail domain-containing protein n=1 Tax=Carboxylicivirga caseinilyticus TaxID=3417572 RepID=UPI003D32648D|nr:lamin tail domain-containing protein [Marinilabiliaceae bacterium A049]